MLASAQKRTEIAAEFVRLKVDVVVTLGSAVPALKRVTSAIHGRLPMPWRKVKVTERRAAEDYAQCMRELVARTCGVFRRSTDAIE